MCKKVKKVKKMRGGGMAVKKMRGCGMAAKPKMSIKRRRGGKVKK